MKLQFFCIYVKYLSLKVFFMKHLALAFIFSTMTAMAGDVPLTPVGGGAEVLSEGLPLVRSNAVFPPLPRIFVDGEEMTTGARQTAVPNATPGAGTRDPLGTPPPVSQLSPDFPDWYTRHCLPPQGGEGAP